ncbi:hypothetical protein F4859DRAFT_136415 [Xylaria cf. heliscus]|nr:hypothetical protein F4859DRAFT_136415 [Xylaria cf. heliscus]
MYSKMNTAAAVGLLTTGVMGQFSFPGSVSLPSGLTSLLSSAVPTGLPTVTPTPIPISTLYPLAADPPSVTTAVTQVHLNGSSSSSATPVWSYFNVTVTSVTVVQQLTTLCEEATTLIFNDCEYPATAGQVVTVTNCPCTVTKAIPTWTSSLCPPEETAKPAPAPPAQVTHATSAPAPAPPAITTTNTHAAPADKPSHTTTSAVQVAGASSVGNGNTAAFVIAAVAVVLGLF